MNGEEGNSNPGPKRAESERGGRDLHPQSAQAARIGCGKVANPGKV